MIQITHFLLHTVPQLSQLVADLLLQRPGFSHRDFWWTK